VESVLARLLEPQTPREDLLEGSLLVYPSALVWVAERYGDPRRTAGMSYWVAPTDSTFLSIGDEKFSGLERILVRLHVTSAVGPEVQFDLGKRAAKRVLKAIQRGKGSFAPRGRRLEYDEIELRLEAPRQVGVPHWFESQRRFADGPGVIENPTDARDVFSVMAFWNGVALYNAEGAASWILWREMKSWWRTDKGNDIRIFLPDDILLTVGGEDLDRWEEALKRAGVARHQPQPDAHRLPQR
jgi:hypothetical protein